MYAPQEKNDIKVFILVRYISLTDIFIYSQPDMCCNPTIESLRQRHRVELKELMRGAHSLVEAKEKQRITQEDMASRIGVGYRTYMEYQRGTNAPLAMKALLNLLVMLEDQEIVRVVREWGEQRSNG